MAQWWITRHVVEDAELEARAAALRRGVNAGLRCGGRRPKDEEMAI